MGRGELTYNSNKGYWISDSRLRFDLDKKIEDVELFGRSLIKFLELYKEFIPFGYKTIYPLYTIKQGGYRQKFMRGYVIILLKGATVKSKMNPFHDRVEGDETIIITWNQEAEFFTSFQEAKSEYHGKRYTWKLPKDQIDQFTNLLKKFAAGCWLGLDKLILGDGK